MRALSRERFPRVKIVVVTCLTILFLNGNKECHCAHLENTTESAPSSQSTMECSKAISTVLDSAFAGVPWAMEMVDACAKPQTGIMRQGFLFPHTEGVFLQYYGITSMNATRFLGNYDQCLDLETHQSFGTQYCTVDADIQRLWSLRMVQTKNVFMDVCVPDVCSKEDLMAVLQQYVDQTPEIVAHMNGVVCRKKQAPVPTSTDLTIIYGLSFFVALALVATVYDIVFVRGFAQVFLENTDASKVDNATDKVSSIQIRRNNNDSSKLDSNCKSPESPGAVGKVLLSFSLYTNCSQLLSTNVTSDSIGCINGIRVLSMSILVLQHVMLFGDLAMQNARHTMKAMQSSWINILLTYNSAQVDTFFVISGLLTTRNTLRKFTTKNPSLGFFLKEHYLHRYLRLTPAYMALLLVYGYLMRFAVDGPLSPVEGSVTEDQSYRHLWWRNLFYLDPITGNRIWIMRWAWYLSFDMLYFLLSPIILLPLHWFGRKGLLVPVSLIGGATFITGIRSFNHSVTPVMATVGDPLEYLNWFVKYYFTPLAHMGPYLVGMIVGYCLHATDRKINMPKSVVAMGWTVFSSVALVTLGAVYSHVNVEPFSNEMSALFNATHRLLWSFFVGWLILACACGYGGIVNKGLSWKAHLPLSRLSYCTYLVQVIVMKVYFTSQRRLIYCSQFNIAIDFGGLYVWSILCAAATYLIFEVPFMNLDKVIKNISRDAKQGKKTLRKLE